MRSRKRKKQNLTLREMIERDINRLPQWRRKYLFETEAQKEYVIRNMLYSVIDAKKQNKKVNIYKALFQQTQEGVSAGRSKREGTLRDIYRAFRTQEVSLYRYYNTFMYRKGKSAAQYFYNPDNSTITDKHYTTVVELELPQGGKNYKYDKLVIEYNWQDNEIVNIFFVDKPKEV